METHIVICTKAGESVNTEQRPNAVKENYLKFDILVVGQSDSGITAHAIALSFTLVTLNLLKIAPNLELIVLINQLK